MAIAKSAVIATTSTLGGLWGKNIGFHIFGSALAGALPFAAIGGYVAYKAVNMSLSRACKKPIATSCGDCASPPQHTPALKKSRPA